MRDFDPTHNRIVGPGAKKYKKLAMKFLGRLKNRLSRFGIQVGRWRRTLADGTQIEVGYSFGSQWIRVVTFAETIKKAVKTFSGLFVCQPTFYYPAKSIIEGSDVGEFTVEEKIDEDQEEYVFYGGPFFWHSRDWGDIVSVPGYTNQTQFESLVTPNKVSHNGKSYTVPAGYVRGMAAKEGWVLVSVAGTSYNRIYAYGPDETWRLLWERWIPYPDYYDHIMSPHCPFNQDVTQCAILVGIGGPVDWPDWAYDATVITIDIAFNKDAHDAQDWENVWVLSNITETVEPNQEVLHLHSDILNTKSGSDVASVEYQYRVSYSAAGYDVHGCKAPGCGTVLAGGVADYPSNYAGFTTGSDISGGDASTMASTIIETIEAEVEMVPAYNGSCTPIVCGCISPVCNYFSDYTNNMRTNYSWNYWESQFYYPNVTWGSSIGFYIWGQHDYTYLRNSTFSYQITFNGYLQYNITCLLPCYNIVGSWSGNGRLLPWREFEHSHSRTQDLTGIPKGDMLCGLEYGENNELIKVKRKFTGNSSAVVNSERYFWYKKFHSTETDVDAPAIHWSQTQLTGGGSGEVVFENAGGGRMFCEVTVDKTIRQDWTEVSTTDAAWAGSGGSGNVRYGADGACLFYDRASGIGLYEDYIIEWKSTLNGTYRDNTWSRQVTDLRIYLKDENTGQILHTFDEIPESLELESGYAYNNIDELFYTDVMPQVSSEEGSSTAKWYGPFYTIYNSQYAFFDDIGPECDDFFIGTCKEGHTLVVIKNLKPYAERRWWRYLPTSITNLRLSTAFLVEKETRNVIYLDDLYLDASDYYTSAMVLPKDLEPKEPGPFSAVPLIDE